MIKPKQPIMLRIARDICFPPEKRLKLTMGERLRVIRLVVGYFHGGFLIDTDNRHDHTGAFTGQSRVALLGGMEGTYALHYR